MHRPLRRALCVLLLAACSRSTPTDPAPAQATAAARANGSPAAPARTQPPPPPPQPQPPRAAPRACLAGEPYAAPAALVEEAERALAGGSAQRALACVEEALRVSPRLARALAAKGRILAETGRLDEARLLLARALAIDADDPSALLASAELHVRRLGGTRDALEVGLEHALRGARAAALRRDAALVARLELVAGMAENDLGRSHLALAHLERALAARPDDADAVYERGVALFELCRFDDAQRAFERALSLAPDDPWALHQLGLLAERRGEHRRAESLLARARTISPEDFRLDLRVDEAAFRAEVEAAISALPEAERRALRDVPIEIQDLPDASDLLAVHPPLSPSILGLFRGPAEDEPCTAADGPRCRSIVFYRKNLVRFARDRKDLSEQVRVTLLHELGHLHGESDEDLRARGLE
jgi:tetratricopeptide (TPR) repeat protein